MDDEVSEWSLQVAVELLGYDNIGEVPDKLIGDVYDLAEDIDD